MRYKFDSVVMLLFTLITYCYAAFNYNTKIVCTIILNNNRVYN